MAEAHSAVAFSFSVTHEGFNVHVSRDALKAVYFSGVRSWRKRQVRFINRFQCGIYPATFSSLGILFLLIFITSFFGWDFTYGLYHIIHNVLFSKTSVLSWILALFLFSSFLWIIGVILVRYTLKLLLSYRGFMFESFGKFSLKTKIWFMLVKLLKGKNPKLYSYQASLPRLPVPALTDTIRRYLVSVRPILNDHDYNEVRNLSEEFLLTIANRLQRYLIAKSWWSSNYVTDWWEKYVYLAGRDPTMVNSNYYGMGLVRHLPSKVQASRAATYVYSVFTVRSTLDQEKIKPILVNGVVPICSAQFERSFNTCRIPGVNTDRVEHWTDSSHIAVYSRGRWYKVFCYKNGKLLRPKDFEVLFEMILNDTSEPDKGEERLAALTAGNRTPWAEARERFFASGVNKTSLDVIEKSAFVLVLDESEYNIAYDDPVSFSGAASSLLHGNCHNRWFDKSCNVVIFKNGQFGFNAEHSWADAPIMCYLLEAALGYEAANMTFDDEGRVDGTSTLNPMPPLRLHWSLPNECLDVIDNSLQVALALANDVHLYVMPFRHFGKGLIKTFKLSPDAFLQTALQLGHYRDKGHFALTYEASMTRLYLEGRTETVRSCTNEVVAFVRSMEDPDSTDQDRYALLKKTVERHVILYKEAMAGMGIDRHLFCLYVVSKYLNLESTFLQKVLSEKWRLSTSQTSMAQTNTIIKSKGMEPAGGGFGPVADDGYGVSYIISHEDGFMFHISSKRSSAETDSKRFAGNIEQAMLDMRDLCLRMPSDATSKS